CDRRARRAAPERLRRRARPATAPRGAGDGCPHRDLFRPPLARGRGTHEPRRGDRPQAARPRGDRGGARHARARGGRLMHLLARLSSVAPEEAHRLWQYLMHGGAANAAEFLRYAAALLGRTEPQRETWREPVALLRAGVLGDAQVGGLRPVAALVVYRALVHAADTAPVDALVSALDAEGIDALPLYVASLKDPVAAETVRLHL